MMQQKVSKYLLIAGVLMIWGLVIYRIISGLASKEELPVPKKKFAAINYTEAKDSFVLYANYPDPFLPPDENQQEETESEPGIPARNVVKKEQSPAPIPAIFDKNSITYHGMIANPDKKKKLAMLTLAGKDYMVRQNEKIEKIRIKKITTEQLIIIVNGKTENIDRAKDQ